VACRRSIAVYRSAVRADQEGHSILRYQGFGEMNRDQPWDPTINPEARQLIQVRIEDAVEPRREFIERNALTVLNLDV
jgi:DNA gyrase subunit B